MLDLLHAYENYLTAVKQASANTVSSYMRDLRQFSQWVQSHCDQDISSVSRREVSDYLLFLQNQGKSGSTISRTLASLKNFFAYLVSSGFIKESPITSDIHVERGEKKLPEILTGREVELLLAQPMPILQQHRNRTWSFNTQVAQTANP